jgi:hypothetical protein
VGWRGRCYELIYKFLNSGTNPVTPYFAREIVERLEARPTRRPKHPAEALDRRWRDGRAKGSGWQCQLECLAEGNFSKLGSTHRMGQHSAAHTTEKPCLLACAS